MIILAHLFEHLCECLSLFIINFIKFYIMNILSEFYMIIIIDVYRYLSHRAHGGVSGFDFLCFCEFWGTV